MPAQGGSHLSERGRVGGGLTVGLVRLVEDVLLKVFLVLHVGVDVGVVVLKHTHTQTVHEAGMTTVCVVG